MCSSDLVDVRLTLTDPHHDRLTLEDDGTRLVVWGRYGPAAQIVIPGGDEGGRILGALARDLGEHLTRQGWEGDAA